MATHLTEWKDGSISIITNDGRNIIGTLKGYDQCINIVLQDSFERVYSTQVNVEIVELGVYIVRGDNIAMVGTVNAQDLASLRSDTARAKPLNPVIH